MMSAARWGWLVTLVLALALSTWAFGWGAVVVVAAAWTWIRREDAAVPLMAAIAGILSWALLLGVQSLVGPVLEVARVVGTAMQVGPVALLLLTLAFPALLAGATAGVIRGVASR